MLKSSLRSWLYHAALAFALAGCAPTDRSTSDIKAEERAGGSVLIVAAGGWGSCQTPAIRPTPYDMLIYAQTRHLAEELQAAGLDAHFLTSCLRVLPPEAGNPLWTMFAANTNAVNATTVGGFPQVIRQTWQSLGQPQIYLVGHSYGGSVVMDAALNLPDVPAVRALYTLDPIGADCLFRDNIIPGIESPECVRPPRRINHAAVASQVGRWVNFHQALGTIHSTAIAAATANQQIFIEDGNLSLAHRRIGYDNTVWQTICREITEDQGVSAGVCSPIIVDANTGQLIGDGTGPLLVNGPYSGNATSACRHNVTVSGADIAVTFTNCGSQHGAGADITCDGTQCRGNEYYLGPRGNKRPMPPAQRRYEMTILNSRSYSYINPRLMTQPLTMQLQAQ